MQNDVLARMFVKLIDFKPHPTPMVEAFIPDEAQKAALCCARYQSAAI
jgi:hypothetical protein